MCRDLDRGKEREGDSIEPRKLRKQTTLNDAMLGGRIVKAFIVSLTFRHSPKSWYMNIHPITYRTPQSTKLLSWKAPKWFSYMSVRNTSFSFVIPLLPNKIVPHKQVKWENHSTEDPPPTQDSVNKNTAWNNIPYMPYLVPKIDELQEREPFLSRTTNLRNSKYQVWTKPKTLHNLE